MCVKNEIQMLEWTIWQIQIFFEIMELLSDNFHLSGCVAMDVLIEIDSPWDVFSKGNHSKKANRRKYMLSTHYFSKSKADQSAAFACAERITIR